MKIYSNLSQIKRNSPWHFSSNFTYILIHTSQNTNAIIILCPSEMERQVFLLMHIALRAE